MKLKLSMFALFFTLTGCIWSQQNDRIYSIEELRGTYQYVEEWIGGNGWPTYSTHDVVISNYNWNETVTLSQARTGAIGDPRIYNYTISLSESDIQISSNKSGYIRTVNGDINIIFGKEIYVKK
jgi:hypothetical protein